MRLSRKDAQALLNEIHKLATEYGIPLTDWEARFIESVKFQSTQYSELTDKQSDIVQKIYRKVSDKAVQ